MLQLPVPREEFVEFAGAMISNAGEDVCEPGLRIDVIELCGDDQRVHDGGAFSAAVGAGEEPGFSAKGNAAQGAFCCVVRQADATLFRQMNCPRVTWGP